MNATPKVDIPIGRVEFLGQTMHVLEHQGRLVAAMADETGQVVVLDDDEISAAACRRLLQSGIDVLFDRAELACQVCHNA